MRAQSSDCPPGADAMQAGAVGEGPDCQQTLEELQALHEHLQEGAGWVCPALDHWASLGAVFPYLSPLQARTVGRCCYDVDHAYNTSKCVLVRIRP